MTHDTEQGDKQVYETMADAILNGIPFTQYLRPDGRKTGVLFRCDDDEVREKAAQMMREGFVFEIEELTTGDVSATVTHPNAERDLAIVVTTNNPALVDGINKMILDFDIQKKKEEMENEQ